MRQFFPLLLLLVLLISFSGMVAGQRALRPAKINRTPNTSSAGTRPSQPVPNGAAASSSGKLVVGGAHAGLVGILQIETDLSLEGPLLIEISSGGMGNDINVRQRPWRVEALGRLKIPETPFLVGFDGNFGKGPDDVRFIFGARFDIGKIMRTLKIAAAEDKVGRSDSPPAGPAPAPAPAPAPVAAPKP